MLKRLWKQFGLRAYRVLMLGIIVWMVHEHHFYVTRQAERPISVEEVQVFLPQADHLLIDRAAREGFEVYDSENQQIGYVLSTFPQCEKLVGYCGPTEVLVVLRVDRAPTSSSSSSSSSSEKEEMARETPLLPWGKESVVGFAIRYSEDTKTHVEDVNRDDYFLEQFNDLTWLELANLDFKEAQIEGVSGATMTSMNIAHGIQVRFQNALDMELTKSPFTVNSRNIGTSLVVLWGVFIGFSNWRGNRKVRLITQLVMIGYLGLWNGDLLAQSLMAGWSQNGVPWKLAPGLVLMLATAFLFPWASRRPVYCSHICPHGAAQQLLIKVVPWRIKLRNDVKRSLRLVPLMLLTFVLLVVLLRLPVDLASIEPFDAYLLSAAGQGTILVAVVGLLFSAFVPMGYCKYGCPTGSVLEFVRSHGRSDRFNHKDACALLLVLFAWGLISWYQVIVEAVLS